MVVFLISDDCLERGRCRLVLAVQRRDLFSHMLENDGLDCDRSRGDGVLAGKAGQRAQHQSADAAQVKASAACAATPGEFASEQVSMPALVIEKPVNFGNKLRCSKARKPSLHAVNADRAMLTGMIDLHYAIAKCFSVL